MSAKGEIILAIDMMTKWVTTSIALQVWLVVRSPQWSTEIIYPAIMQFGREYDWQSAPILCSSLAPVIITPFIITSHCTGYVFFASHIQHYGGISLYLLYINCCYYFIFPDIGITASILITFYDICYYVLCSYHLPELPSNLLFEYYWTVLPTAVCNRFALFHQICLMAHLVWWHPSVYLSYLE